MEEFNSELGNMKNKEINLVITPFNRKEILERVGYSIDNEKFLIDKKDKCRVKAEDGKEINIDEDKNFALIGGSHIFVRNIAGFSQYLAERGLLKFRAKD